MIVQDALHPGRLLFNDEPVGKIKSLNLTTYEVRTEYAANPNAAPSTEYSLTQERIAALAQNPYTGDVYFTRQTLDSLDVNVYLLRGGNLNTTAELLGRLKDKRVTNTHYAFTNMVSIHNATKLVVIKPRNKFEADVRLLDVTATQTTPLRECNIGIVGLTYDDGATGLLLDADDTLYFGCQAGIAKIKNFSKVVSLLCPN